MGLLCGYSKLGFVENYGLNQSSFSFHIRMCHKNISTWNFQNFMSDFKKKKRTEQKEQKSVYRNWILHYSHITSKCELGNDSIVLCNEHK